MASLCKKPNQRKNVLEFRDCSSLSLLIDTGGHDSHLCIRVHNKLALPLAKCGGQSRAPVPDWPLVTLQVKFTSSGHEADNLSSQKGNSIPDQFYWLHFWRFVDLKIRKFSPKRQALHGFAWNNSGEIVLAPFFREQNSGPEPEKKQRDSRTLNSI